MYSRIQEVPVYESIAASVEAARFNRVRLALLRLANPLRLELDGLRHMDMILDDDAWVCVDCSMDDLPVVAWIDFEVQGRDNLHRPVACRRLSFHCNAEVIASSALKIMDELLRDGLGALATDRSARKR